MPFPIAQFAAHASRGTKRETEERKSCEGTNVRLHRENHNTHVCPSLGPPGKIHPALRRLRGDVRYRAPRNACWDSAAGIFLLMRTSSVSYVTSQSVPVRCSSDAPPAVFGTLSIAKGPKLLPIGISPARSTALRRRFQFQQEWSSTSMVSCLFIPFPLFFNNITDSA